MEKDLNKLLEAISFFLAGTFLLQIIQNQEITQYLSDNSAVAIYYAGYGFLVIGVILVLMSLPFASKIMDPFHTRINKYLIFSLFLVTLSAIVATGIPINLILTLAIFYLVCISFAWLSFKHMWPIVKIDSKSLAGTGKLFISAGLSILWFWFVGSVFSVKLPYDLQLLISGCVLFVVGGSLMLINIIVKHRKIKENAPENNWLSELSRAEMHNRRPPILLSEKLQQLSVPNLRTISYIVIALAFSLLFSWLLYISTPGLILIRTEGTLRDFFLTMWQVQGAVAAVALPLLIVVIQFSRDLRQAATRRPEALIQETWVFPIIVFALAGTARLGMDIVLFNSEPVFWADFFLVFLATLSLTVLAYVRMLSVLLSPLRMKKSSMRVVRNKMNSQLDQTIEERVANMILFGKLGDMGMEYWPYSPGPEEEERYIVLRTSAIGALRDVHLGKLEMFINRLPRKEPGLVSFGVSELEIEKGKSLRESQPQRYIWWMKRYGQSITSQNDGILRLDRSLFNISDPEFLEAQLGELVRVVKEDDGYELRLELSYLRDGLMDAIKDGKTGAVQDGLQIYEELVATFLDKLHQWGSTYRRHQAIRTSTSIEGGWFEIRWITDDLQEIIDMAMQTENISVIREVLHFPIHLASLAFSHGDYYIFHQFIDWVPYYYVTGLKLRDSRARDFIIGRCSMYLAEIARYQIIHSIEYALTEENVEVGSEFAKGIVLTFNRLLKSAYDEGEIEHFKDFSATIHSVFESYLRNNQEHELLSLEHQLKNPSLTDVQRSKVEQKLSLKRRQVHTATDLQETIETILYGLNAWLVHAYIINKVSLDDFEKWNQAFTRPTNLKEAWRLFSISSKQEDKSDYGWSFWQSQEQRRGVAFAGITMFSGGFDANLRMLFCVHCLRIIGEMEKEERESAIIPHSRDTIWLAENETSPLRQLLGQIEQDTTKWKTIIGEKGLGAVSSFKELLEKAVQEQKKDENEFIRAADLSIQRVELVKRDIVETWGKEAKLREIVRIYGDYKFISDVPEGASFFGFNQLESKDIFIDDTNIAITGVGSQFGRALATSEDEDFIGKIINNIRSLDCKESEKDLIENISDGLDRLERDKYRPVIMILNSWRAVTTIEQSDLFDKEENHFGYGLIGQFRNKPVFDLHYRGEPYVIMIDLNKFCSWQQCKPKQIFEGEEYLADELTFLIRPFTEESAKIAIQQNPKLLLDEQQNQRPEDEVVSELQLRVHFRLLEQLEIKIKDKDSGYKLSVQR